MQNSKLSAWPLTFTYQAGGCKYTVLHSPYVRTLSIMTHAAAVRSKPSLSLSNYLTTDLENASLKPCSNEAC